MNRKIKYEYKRVFRKRKPSRVAELKMLNAQGLKRWQMFAIHIPDTKNKKAQTIYHFRRKIKQ